MPKLSSYNTVVVFGSSDFLFFHNSGISNSRISIPNFASGLLPSQAGQSGKILATNGASGLSWVASGGGGGSPGGSNTQVQFNGAGSFSGSSSFVYSGGRVYIDRIGSSSLGSAGNYTLSISNFNAVTGDARYGEFGIGLDENGHAHLQSFGSKHLIIQDYGNNVGFFGHPNTNFGVSFQTNVGPSGNNTYDLGSSSYIWKSGYFNYLQYSNLSGTSGSTISGGTLSLVTPLALSFGGTASTTASGAINTIVPSQGGNSGKVLATDGSTVLWATSGGGGTPGGSDTYIQFNSGGAFAGSSGLIWHHQSGRMALGGIGSNVPSGLLQISPVSGVSGIIINSVANQGGNSVALLDSSNNVLAGIKADGSYIMQYANTTSIIGSTYYATKLKTDNFPGGFPSTNLALVLERSPYLNAAGQGIGLFFKDNAVYCGIRLMANTYVQNNIDFEILSRGGLTYRAPNDGGNLFYNATLNSLDFSALQIPTQTFSIGGGSPPFAAFSVKPCTLSATSPITVSEDAAIWIQSALADGANVTTTKRYALLSEAGFATAIAACFKAASGQTANITEWQSSGSGQAGTLLAAFTNSGHLSVSGSGSFNTLSAFSGIITPTSGTVNVGSLTNPFNSGYFSTVYANKIVVNSGFSGAAFTYPYIIGWSFPSGLISGNATNASYEIPVLRPCILQSGAYCYANAKTAPSGTIGTSGGSGVIFDIVLNGTTDIWTDKTKRIKIADQAKSGNKSSFDYSGVIGVGSYFHINIMNYPTGQYANDIIVQLMLMSQHP